MKTRIEYHSPTDEKGECSFSLFWMADYHPGHPQGEHRTAERGQCFRADPRKYGHPLPEDVKQKVNPLTLRLRAFHPHGRGSQRIKQPHTTKNIMKTKDSFISAYISTALWSSTDDEGNPLDSQDAELSTDAHDKMENDCRAFREKCDAIISAAIETGKVKCGRDFDEYGRAAHDLWLTRNGHGAGFWDGDWPEPFASQLTEIAQSFGTCDLYVGDDGLIYAS